MPTYTFEPGLALDADTLYPAANADGVLTATSGGTPLSTWDINGLLTTIRTNTRGYFAGFKADVPVALLSFGDVALPVVSVEARDSGLEAAAAQSAAEAAADSASQSASEAFDARAAAEAAAAAAEVVPDSAIDAGVDRAVTDGRVVGPVTDRSLELTSSYAGGDDNGLPGAFDSTRRLTLHSYQRAGTNKYGEVLRMYAHRADSEQMQTWYAPKSWDPGTLEPIGDFAPVFGAGWHFESANHTGVDGHWSVEVPDNNGDLQPRFEIRTHKRGYGYNNPAAFGLDKTNILTNMADFTVRAAGGVLRVAGGNTTPKEIEFSLDIEGSDAQRRWKVRTNNATETGANSGSDFEIARYTDAGVYVDPVVKFKRDTGYAGFGTTDPQARVQAAGDGVRPAFRAVQAVTSPSQANFHSESLDTVSRAIDVRVTGDTVARFQVNSDGKIELGDGSLRDVNLYRSAANQLKTDDSLLVDTDLTVNGDVRARVRPSSLAPQRWRKPVSILTLFQAGHGWTASGALGSSDLNSTASFVRGTQAARVTTNGLQGGGANLQLLTGLNLDLTNKALRFLVKVDNPTALKEFNFLVGTNDSFANSMKWQMNVTTGTSKRFLPGEWTLVEVSWADLHSAAGTFTLDAMRRPSSTSGFLKVRFQIIDNGAPVTVHVQSVEILNDGQTTFPTGVVSLTFDDSWKSQWDLARPALNKYGYRGTVFPIVERVGTGTGMTVAQLRSLQDDSGWEIGGHSFTQSAHDVRFNTLTTRQVETEISKLKNWLVDNGLRGDSFAYPGGQYETTTDGGSIEHLVSRYFSSGRTVLTGYGSAANVLSEHVPPPRPYRMLALSGISDFTTGQGNPNNLLAPGGELDTCAEYGSWLQMTFHVVKSGAAVEDGEIDLTAFTSLIDGIAARGIEVLPIGEVIKPWERA